MSRYSSHARIFALLFMLAVCRFVLASPVAPIHLVTRWTGEVSKVNLSSAQKEWLKAHDGVVRVGVLRDEEVPLDIVDAAENYQGISAEYLGILATALSLHFEISAFADRASLMDALAAGTVDLVTGAQRAGPHKTFLYSQAYFGNRAVLATRVEDPGFAIRPSYHDNVLAYARGTIDAVKLQAAYPRMHLLPQPSLLAALNAVAFGQADACVGNASAVNGLIEWHQLLNVGVTDVAQVAAEDFRFAVAERNAPLMQMVSEALSRIRYGDREVIRALWEGFGTHYTFSNAITLNSAEREWVAHHRVVKYAMRQTFSPFILEREDGAAVGLGIDLLGLIGQQTGLRFEPVDADAAPMTRGEAVPDIIVAAALSDPTLSEWLPTAPYASPPEVIVARTTRSYHGVASLSGKKVVVGPGFSPSRAALEKVGASILSAKNVWVATDLLTTGIADAWVTNATTANYITQFNENFAIVGATGAGAVRIAFSVRPGNGPLVGILNDGLASISASRMHGLRDKWQFSRQVRTPWDKRRPQILTIVLGTLLLVVLFLVWNYLLRKEIRRRKRAEHDLAEAMQVAEDASRAKSTFLATMSHEIRTPMNAVLGVLELLKQSRKDDSQSASIDAAYDSARALLSLIEDILDLSKIESDKLELATEPTDLDALVRSIGNVFEGLARQRQIRFRLDIENPQHLGAMIDPIRLRQILSNLLSNAVKFTHVGEVSLKAVVSAEARDEVLVYLRVKDTGIGMSLDEQAKLFRPFAQADRTIGARYGGSGLGLTICKRLIDLMGGTMGMTSVPGAGTTVEISLMAPRATIIGNDDVSSLPLEVWRDRFQSYVALIVDDHPANRLVLSRQLEYLGFSVVCAQDGYEALEQMSSMQFDIVITDLFMAGITGYELAREIRARELTSKRHVFLVGCTANAQHETLRQAVEAGMDICVTKPLGLMSLAKRTSDWLSDRRTARPMPSPFSTVPKVDALSKDWIDSSGVEQIVAGDPQLELKLLDAIATANHETLERLRQAVANDDRQGFRAASHHLRSGIRLIGAEAVVRVCEQAEQQAVESETALVELLPAIEMNLTRLDQMLVERMARLREGSE
jgi:two-component system sensor histidine kinase EvgS